MIDREKVIDELVSPIENALSVDSDYVDCIPTDLLQYAVAMLKEQDRRWEELRFCIKEMSRNGGTGSQQEVCSYIAHLMETIEGRAQP